MAKMDKKLTRKWVYRPERLVFGTARERDNAKTSWWTSVPRDQWREIAAQQETRLAMSRAGNRRVFLD